MWGVQVRGAGRSRAGSRMALSEMKRSFPVWSARIPLTCQKISVTASLGPEHREAGRSQGKPGTLQGLACCAGRAAADTAEPE